MSDRPDDRSANAWSRFASFARSPQTRRAGLGAALCAIAAPFLPRNEARAAGTPGEAWRFAFETVDGAPMPLTQWRGKVLLVVNTASHCGFTYQYKGLQAVYDRFKGRGLVVVGVPSNDFGGQEPGSNEEIKGFCGGTYGVTFPLAAKSVVRGPEAHPFYRWAAETLGPDRVPRWNFHKYLVGRDGRLRGGYGGLVEPENATLIAAIEAALAERAQS